MVVNLVLPSLHWGSKENTLTVPLIVKRYKNQCTLSFPYTEYRSESFKRADIKLLKAFFLKSVLKQSKIKNQIFFKLTSLYIIHLGQNNQKKIFFSKRCYQSFRLTAKIAQYYKEKLVKKIKAFSEKLNYMKTKTHYLTS